MSRARKIKKRGGRPRKTSVSVTAAPFNGDWGPQTQAAVANSELVEVTDENGKNPNRMKRRQRIDVLARLVKSDAISMRQFQAGEAIRDAYSRVEMLSSGGELKEVVDSSARPDAAVAAQVEAHSRWAIISRLIRSEERAIVEHVCIKGQRLQAITQPRAARFLHDALNRVADGLGY